MSNAYVRVGRRTMSNNLRHSFLVVFATGCCINDPFGIEFQELCLDERKFDGGVGDAAPVGRQPWTVEGDRVIEPDVTSASTEGPPIGAAGAAQGPYGNLVTLAEYTCWVEGRGCVERISECGKAYSYSAPTPTPGRSGTILSTTCDLKRRNDVTPAELNARWLEAKAACAQVSGFEMRQDELGDYFHFLGNREDRGQVILAYDRLFACSMSRCAELNTFDAADRDGDALNDSCDCTYTRTIPDSYLQRTCVGEPRTNPGWLTCQPNESELSCVPFDSLDEWYRASVFGGGPSLANAVGGRGVAADYSASVIEYDYEDGIEVNCPEGANCEAARSRKRGALYEKFLCLRAHGMEYQKVYQDSLRRPRPELGGDAVAILAEEEALRAANAVRCSYHPNPNNPRPSYTTLAFDVTLPFEVPEEYSAFVPQTIRRQGGGIRYPDITIRTPNQVMMHEGKCYKQIDWDSRAIWLWLRSLSFLAQFTSYTTKAQAGIDRNPRDGGPPALYSIAYHFCGPIPNWLRLMWPYGVAGDFGQGRFEVDSFDVYAPDNIMPLGEFRDFSDDPAYDFITDDFIHEPVFDDMLGIADSAFNCFVPGSARYNNVSPELDCTGVWYDLVGGSE